MKKLLSKILITLLLVLLMIPLLTGCALSTSDAITADTVSTVLQTLVTAVVIPALIFIGKAAFDWLKTKTTNAKLQKYLDGANDAISTATAEVMQTFVTTLKNNGTFTKEAQIQALQMARDKAIIIMGVAAYKALPEIVGDVQVWLTSKIEAATLAAKNSMPTSLLEFSVGDGVK